MAANELARLMLRIEADTKRLRGDLKIAEGATRRTGSRMARLRPGRDAPRPG